MKETISSSQNKNLETISRNGINRRSMLKFFGASAAVIAFGSACNKDDVADNAVNLGSGDVGVLNYAYALEQLEAAFYIKATQSNTAGLSVAEAQYFRDIAQHEIIHRELFKAALGSNAIPALTVDFTSINFNDRTSLLAAARDFEDTGVSAYNGAGKLLVNTDFLALAGKIVSVEARHAAAIKDLISSGTFADTTDANGLDIVRTPAEVLAIIKPFVVTPLNANNLPTS